MFGLQDLYLLKSATKIKVANAIIIHPIKLVSIIL